MSEIAVKGLPEPIPIPNKDIAALEMVFVYKELAKFGRKARIHHENVHVVARRSDQQSLGDESHGE